MRVIAFIEHEDVIKKILPRRTSPQAFGLVGGEVDDYVIDPDTPVEAYF
jgi:hypothetical protein